MNALSSKLQEMFQKKFKSDAKPRPPRPETEVRDENKETTQENGENVQETNEQEDIFIESDEDTNKNDKKPKFKKTFFKPGKKDKKNDKDGSSYVNTQATGNVINIVNSKNLRMGNDYYMGPTNMRQSHFPTKDEEPEECIEKCNLIQLLLESKIKPDHPYIDYIAKNLGKNWKSIFRAFGFTKGAIETMEIDTKSYGVSEARYKLLLSWINNDDDGSLGRLATLLWEEGERQVVKDLALLYNKNNNNKK